MKFKHNVIFLFFLIVTGLSFGIITHSGDVYTTEVVGGGNSTAEIWSAMNTSAYFIINVSWDNMVDIPAGFADGVDNTTTGDTGNTTEEMQDAIGAMVGSHLTYNDGGDDLSVDDDWWDAASDVGANVLNSTHILESDLDLSSFNASWNYTVDTDTWNTTVEMRNAVNISTYYIFLSPYALIANLVSLVGNWTADKSSYYTSTVIDTLGNWTGDKDDYYTAAEVRGLNASWNYTVDTDTDTWNTTEEMINAVNQSGYYYVIDVDKLEGQDGSYYLDNTDAQTLSYGAGNVTITGGNSVNISGVDTDTQLSGAEVAAFVGNWTGDKDDYYTAAEVRGLNASWNYTVDTDTDTWNTTEEMQTAVNVSTYYIFLSPYTLIANLVSLVGNWTADKLDYYTSVQVDTLGNWTADKDDYYTAAEVRDLNASWNYTVDTDTTYSHLSNFTDDIMRNASNVSMDYLSGATYTTAQDYMDVVMSSGRISGGVISDNEDGTFAVSSGTGLIRVSDSPTANNIFFDWSANNSITLASSNILYYVYVDYNSGSPRISTTTDRGSINFNTEFTLGRVYKNGDGSHHVVNSGVNIGLLAQQEHERLLAVRGFERASGGTVTETATLSLYATAGEFYLGFNNISTVAFNTSVSNLTYWYRNGTGGWNEYDSDRINNTHWDDGTGTLNDLTVNRYGVHWVYIHYDSDIHVVYGQGDYTLSLAQLATPPSSLPSVVADFSKLAAKVIVQQGSSTFESITSAYTTPFPVTNPANHNDLGGLDTGDYQHLTQAQHDTNVLSTNVESLVGNWSGDSSNYYTSAVIDTLGNWSGDKDDYYTAAEVRGLNASWNYTVDTDTDTWNTTEEMINAVNGTALDLSNAYDYTETAFNTTAQMQEAVNKSTYYLFLAPYVQLSNLVNLVGNWTADKSDYYTSAIIDTLGNWTADKSDYYTSAQVDTVGNWTADKDDYYTSAVIDTLGNWSGDKSDYYTSAQVDTVGNWTADKSDYYTSAQTDTAITNANTSQTTYIDAQDIVYNDSQKTYIDAQDTAFNTSQKNWIETNYYTAAEVRGLNASWNYTVDTDTDTWNTTEEMINAVNQSGYYYVIDVDKLEGQDGSYYLDNTDAQTLSYGGGNVTISGGNSVNISGVDTDTQLSGVEVAAFVGNWTGDKDDYYTAAEVRGLNASWNYTVDTDTDTWNTTEEMQDAAGAMATNGDGVDFTYDDGANTLTPTFDCSDVAGTGMDCSGEDLIHSDTSSQASIDNSAITFIQDLVLDTYGHITGQTSTAIPTATPSDGDTTHLSTADQIFDYIVSLGYIASASLNTFAELDAQIADATLLNKTYADATYLDNTDAQTLSYGAGNVTISGGNSVNISGVDTDTTYTAGNGISLTDTTFSVAGNTALTQDADGLSVTADGITDTQLEYNTGQHLTTTSDVAFGNVNLTNPGGSTSLIINPGSTASDAIIVLRNYTDSLWLARMDYSQSQNLEFYSYILGDEVLHLYHDGSAYFQGDVSALSFTDRTTAPKDTVDVLTELAAIKVDNTECIDNKCEIDKSTLPVEMVKEYQECVEYEEVFNAELNQTDEVCIREETKLGRDLTYTVSHLLKQNQEQQILIDDLTARITALEAAAVEPAPK